MAACEVDIKNLVLKSFDHWKWFTPVNLEFHVNKYTVQTLFGQHLRNSSDISS